MWSKYPPILKNTIDFIATYSEPWRSFRGFLELKHLRQLYPKSRSSFQNLPRLTLGLEHPNMRAYNVHFTCDTGCNIKKSHSGDRLHALFRCTCVRCTFSFLFNFTLQKLASFGVLYLYGKEDTYLNWEIQESLDLGDNCLLSCNLSNFVLLYAHHEKGE